MENGATKLFPFLFLLHFVEVRTTEPRIANVCTWSVIVVLFCVYCWRPAARFAPERALAVSTMRAILSAGNERVQNITLYKEYDVLELWLALFEDMNYVIGCLCC